MHLLKTLLLLLVAVVASAAFVPTRFGCRQGGMTTSVALSRQDAFERVSNTIVGTLTEIEASTIKDDSSFMEDLGADSLDIVELIMAIEEEFSMEIDESVVADMATVEHVLDYLGDTGVIDE